MKRGRKAEKSKQEEKQSAPYISQSKMQKNKRVYLLHRHHGVPQWVDLQSLKLHGYEYLIKQHQSKKNQHIQIFESRIKNGKKQYLVEKGRKNKKNWVLGSTLIDSGAYSVIQEFQKAHKKDDVKTPNVSNRRRSPRNNKQTLQPQKKRVFKKDLLKDQCEDDQPINNLDSVSESPSDDRSPNWGRFLNRQQSSSSNSFIYNQRQQRLPSFGDQQRQSRRSLHQPLYRNSESSRSLTSLITGPTFLNEYRERRQSYSDSSRFVSPIAQNNKRQQPPQQKDTSRKMLHPILRRNPRTIFAQHQLFTHDKMPPHSLLVNGTKPIIVRGIHHRMTNSMGFIACFDGQFHHVPQEIMKKHYPDLLLQFLSRRYHKLLMCIED